MIELYARLERIDYDKLLSRIQSREGLGTLASWFVKAPVISFGLKRAWLMRSPLRKLAEGYGVSLTLLRLNSKTLIDKGGRGMLNLSVSIESIDYQKLAGAISAWMRSEGGIGSETLRKVAETVKPFIGETMSTIPPDAIAKLFDLLARDVLIEKAGSLGVKISEVSLEPDEAV